MTKSVRGTLEEPTLLRLDEPIDAPLHVQVDVNVTVPEPAPADPGPSTFLAVARTLSIDAPPDFSERWREYVREDEERRGR